MKRFRKLQLQDSYAEKLGFKSNTAYVCDDDTSGKLYEHMPNGGTLIESSPMQESFDDRIDVDQTPGTKRSSVVTESDRVKAYSRKFRISEREAAAHLGVKLIESADDRLREAWRKFCPVLNDREIETLIAKKITPGGR
jgi:hypothetical protein